MAAIVARSAIVASRYYVHRIFLHFSAFVRKTAHFTGPPATKHISRTSTFCTLLPTTARGIAALYDVDR